MLEGNGSTPRSLPRVPAQRQDAPLIDPAVVSVAHRAAAGRV